MKKKLYCLLPMINVRFFNTSGENIFLKKGNDRKTEFEGLKFGLS